MCVQRRFRSAWASAQSDQCLRCAVSGYRRNPGFSVRTVKTLIRLGDILWRTPFSCVATDPLRLQTVNIENNIYTDFGKRELAAWCRSVCMSTFCDLFSACRCRSRDVIFDCGTPWREPHQFLGCFCLDSQFQYYQRQRVWQLQFPNKWK